jgi:phage gpG-like protein
VPGISFFMEGLGSTEVAAADLRTIGFNIRSFKVPLDRIVRQVMVPSIRTNFEVEGRPRWVPLAEYTMNLKARKGRSEPSRVLVDSGRLRTVATQIGIWKVDRDNAYIQTLKDAPYGFFHQTGFRSGFSGRQVPARPWALVQDEDVDKMEDIFEIWLDERIQQYWLKKGALVGGI